MESPQVRSRRQSRYRGLSRQNGSCRDWEILLSEQQNSYRVEYVYYSITPILDSMPYKNERFHYRCSLIET